MLCTSPADAGGETATLGNFASLLNLVFAAVVARRDQLFCFRVLQLVADFLHSYLIGNTPVKKLEIRGVPLYVKLENSAVSRAYKDRGAMVAVLQAFLSGATQLVAASTGNHGLAVRLAAQKFSLGLTIMVPAETPGEKLKRLYGPNTEVVVIQGDFAAAKKAAENYAADGHAAFVPPYNAVSTVCGQASIGVELAALGDEVQTVVCPIGGGGLIAGVALALWASGSKARVYGVNVESAPSAHLSFRAGEVVAAPTSPSLAEGVLVEEIGEIPWGIIRDLVADVVCVTESEVAEAMVALDQAGVTAEGAGAISVAAILAGKIPLGVNPPVCIISGGNVSEAKMQKAYDLVREVTPIVA